MDGNHSFTDSDVYSSSLDISVTNTNLSIYSSCNESSNFSECNSFENSWFSQYSDLESHLPGDAIPVIVGHRPVKPGPDQRKSACRVIRRENKCVQALTIPTTLVYNMRSIWSKLNNFSEDMIERSANICFLSEVWEKSENKKHQAKIEEISEMKGISYISTPRPGAKRGGGAGIAFNLNQNMFTLSKLNISIPKPLEVVWGLLRPIEQTGDIRKIICSFYSPPNSRKNNSLIDHISVVWNSLKMQHPNAGTLISGDKNSLDDKKILALDPRFNQIVSRNTRKDKILSIIITDLESYFHVPEIIPPVPVDVLGKGVPSDHNGVLALPLTSSNSQRKTVSRKVEVRPLPESAMLKFGEALANDNWEMLEPHMSSTELVQQFEQYTSDLVETVFPQKTVLYPTRTNHI